MIDVATLARTLIPMPNLVLVKQRRAKFRMVDIDSRTSV